MGTEPADDGDEPGDASVDPFADLTLDEDFVRAAPVVEPPADERTRRAQERVRRRTDPPGLQSLQHPAGGALGPDRDGRDGAGRDGTAGGRPGGPSATDWQDWEGWNDPDHPPLRRSRRRSAVLRVIALILVVALVLVYVASHLVGIWAAWQRSDRGGESSSATTTVPAGADPVRPMVDLVEPDQRPTPAADRSDEPLGSPAAVPGEGGTHAFLATQSDGVNPVAYDPCRPIHVVTRPGGPPEGDELVRDALASVSAATGLVFIDDGTTDEAPSASRALVQPERYGDRWAPVLIAWSDPVESPPLGMIDPAAPQSDPAAYAGSTAVTADPGAASAGMVYVSGSVVLDTDDLTELSEGPDGRARTLAVLRHEFAHLVGLGHVEDRDELMYPTMQAAVTSFGPGDLEGLAALGRGACFPQV